MPFSWFSTTPCSLSPSLMAKVPPFVPRRSRLRLPLIFFRCIASWLGQDEKKRLDHLATLFAFDTEYGRLCISYRISPSLLCIIATVPPRWRLWRTGSSFVFFLIQKIPPPLFNTTHVSFSNELPFSFLLFFFLNSLMRQYFNLAFNPLVPRRHLAHSRISSFLFWLLLLFFF